MRRNPLPAAEVAAGILKNFGNGKNRRVAAVRDGGARKSTGNALGAQ
ncbi:MAG: hypothetical protein ABSE50_26080 [Xanthobacteraceae bacterium]|jgi:hypothetical protein